MSSAIVAVAVAISFPLIVWVVCENLCYSMSHLEFTHYLLVLHPIGAIMVLYAGVVSFDMSRPASSDN